MSTVSENPFASPATFAADAAANERAEFIGKTYSHLAGAITAFMALEALLLNTIPHQYILGLFVEPMYLLVLLGGFMVAGYVANYWASHSTSMTMQYAGLSLYVVAEAVIFLPMLLVASKVDPNVIPTAGLATLAIFGTLTVSVFATRHNFSYLGPGLSIASMGAFGLILASIFFGFSLGILFSVAMVVLAAGYILYDTSKVLHEYRIGQHVAASLALFASVALLFWYVLRIAIYLYASGDD